MVKPRGVGKLGGVKREQTSEEARKAHNEALFRDANESVRAVQQDLGIPDGPMPFICECDDPACRTIVRLTPAAYEAIRADATHFFIAPNHPTDGETVEERPAYTVVEKTGIAAEIALDTDPRKD
jgi:hypothetical protein